jgi:transcriptional regulator with XRE-family HTH domain
MPRPGPPRTVTHEVNLARRIAYEREKRNWTYEALAGHMSSAGCPVGTSTLHKIEKGDPPRRINVDEFLTFARIFETRPMELLRHPEELERQALATAMQEVRRAEEKAAPHLKRLWDSLEVVSRELDHHPESRPAVSAPLGDLSASFSSLYSRLREVVEPDTPSADPKKFVIYRERVSDGEHPEAR